MKIAKRILIIRTDRIGDVTLTLPLASIIKDENPDNYVVFLVRNYTAPLVKLNAKIDKVISFDDLSFWQKIKILKEEHFDTVIHVYPVFELVLLSVVAGIKERIGTGYRWYSFLLNKKVYEHRKTGDKHELEFNVKLLEKIGIEFNPDYTNVDFSIQPKDEDIKRVSAMLTEKGVKKGLPTVIIHPGSGGSAIDLPLTKFIDLVKLLARSLKFNIIVTGSEAEKEICNQLTVSDNVLNFSGIVNLNELVALIELSDLLVANSTGPIHLAAALGKQVIGFYPKFNECSPQRWGPYTEKKFIFQPTINCTGCNRQQCETLNCMNSIKAEDVFNQTEKILSAGV